MGTELLTENQINEALKELQGWEYREGCIKKVFRTKDYPSTLGFVTAVGAVCQKLNHHPDYVLMKYKEVEISFSTHSAGGVTEKDLTAAKELNKLIT